MDDIFYWTGFIVILTVGIFGVVAGLGWFGTWCIDRYLHHKNIRASFIEWHFKKVKEKRKRAG